MLNGQQVNQKKQDYMEIFMVLSLIIKELKVLNIFMICIGI